MAHLGERRKYVLLALGERRKRLAHAVMSYAIAHEFHDRDMCQLCEIGFLTLQNIQNQRSDYIGEGTFSNVAEGVGMVAEELLTLISAKHPLEPLCPARVAALKLCIPLPERAKKALAAKLRDHMAIMGMGDNTKAMSRTCNINPDAIRNTLSMQRLRTNRETIEKLAGAFKMDMISLLQEILA